MLPIRNTKSEECRLADCSLLPVHRKPNNLTFTRNTTVKTNQHKRSILNAFAVKVENTQVLQGIYLLIYLIVS